MKTSGLILRALLLITLSNLLFIPPARVEKAIVHGILFYLPSCQNCQKVINDPQTQNDPPIFILKFLQDPIANSIAIIVLVVMIISVIFSGYRFINPRSSPNIKISGWSISILCILGLGVAGYLTYVEITQSKAICGPIGNCNSVQQSPYAKLFGVLPVGVLGMIGYLGIIIVWITWWFGSKNLKNITSQVMWGMALLGTLFSIYLTFLEPFIIGATCAWCITSAILITVILVITTFFTDQSALE